jgi:hypothetical protein
LKVQNEESTHLSDPKAFSPHVNYKLRISKEYALTLNYTSAQLGIAIDTT